MKKLLAAILLTGVATLGTTTVAEARDGCGRGAYRGPAGHCRVMRGGPAFVGGPAYRGGPRLIVGRRYDRGYWDGRRYWQNRYRHHGGWRYR
ncbi:hypothetical protein U1872_18960 [Sphingomonas sp. RB3P16]|uniref:GCG_CRPN prefix-to-repeats domain-containing protein n=1 Tax=Parasphingomonas frigoris TaxID=3096163 RepID=UPI002FC88A05